MRAGVGPQQIERGSSSGRSPSRPVCSPALPMGDVADETLRARPVVPPGRLPHVFTGDVQNLNETKGFVLEALLLAVVFIYLILASLFGSFIQPLSIMLALPLSFLGVALALLVTGGTST
jgi:hydrophobic/amphiphilic exporter-1 (mainly G- bacteria), HAE1 family